MSNPTNSGQPSGDKPLFSLGGAGMTNKDESSSATKTTFGSAISGSSNLFGGFKVPTPTSTSSPFGSVGGQAASTTGWSFGTAKSDDNKPADSPSFGNFSTPNKPASNTDQTQSASLFGNLGTASNTNASAGSGSATPTTSKPQSLFGNLSTTPAGPPPATSGGMFNIAPANKSGPSLFGNMSTGISGNTTTNTTSTSNLFGSRAQQSSSTTQSTTPSLFGSNNTPKTTGSNLFGGQASQAQTSTLFGNPTTDSRTADSTAAPAAKPSPFSFSKIDNQKPMENSTTSMVSSASTSQDTNLSTAKTPFNLPSIINQNNTSFGKPTTTSSTPPLVSNSTSTTAPATNLFSGLGQKAGTSDSVATQTPSLIAPQENQKNDASAAAPSSTGGLFTNLGERKDSAPISNSASNLFSGLGQKRDASDPSTKLQGAPNLAPSSSSGPTTSSLFGSTSKPSDSSTTSLFGSTTKPADSTTATNQNTAATTGSGALNLGASTSGPAPSAQSRLKNKSMDEIITRWASDLGKYQKEFQTQADKVALWDRMLLDNGNAISKLYSKTFQAERDTAEVQRQLSAVEGNQEELALWLDRYERDVDEMMIRQVGQGEGLQGPDQERERTYKTAERVSDRLSDMGKDLTTIIEEINEANAAISTTNKADDPLSHIVRVLNGHLSQLQVIDQSTSALQAKVTAAQKESQRLGSRTQGVLGNNATDDFYRSYTSRV